MTCEGGTKVTPVEHRTTLRERDCTLRNGCVSVFEHVFTSKTTEPWSVNVEVRAIASEGIRFPDGNRSVTTDKFEATPSPASDYLFRLFLRGETSEPVERKVKFVRRHRSITGDGASVEVIDEWSLGRRTQSGSFGVNFKVGD
jgi:hypothetical protein